MPNLWQSKSTGLPQRASGEDVMTTPMRYYFEPESLDPDACEYGIYADVEGDLTLAEAKIDALNEIDELIMRLQAMKEDLQSLRAADIK